MDDEPLQVPPLVSKDRRRQFRVDDEMDNNIKALATIHDRDFLDEVRFLLRNAIVIELAKLGKGAPVPMRHFSSPGVISGHVASSARRRA